MQVEYHVSLLKYDISSCWSNLLARVRLSICCCCERIFSLRSMFSLASIKFSLLKILEDSSFIKSNSSFWVSHVSFDCLACNDSNDNVTQILISSSLKYSLSFSTLWSSVSFLICEFISADLFSIGDIVSSVSLHVLHVNSNDLANMLSIFWSLWLLVAVGKLVPEVVSESSSCLSSVSRSFRWIQNTILSVFVMISCYDDIRLRCYLMI